MFTSFGGSGSAIIKKIGERLLAERWITLLAVERERERERSTNKDEWNFGTKKKNGGLM